MKYLYKLFFLKHNSTGVSFCGKSFLKKNYIFLLLLTFVFFSSCSKSDQKISLSDSAITFQYSNEKDTISNPLVIRKDSAQSFGLLAKINMISSSNHNVTLAVDTTKYSDYIAQYGQAILLPSSNYFFYKPTAQITAGATLSDSIQINIIKETKLIGDTTYVLPIIVKTIDGIEVEATSNQITYLVFNTGSSNIISRNTWTIEAASSYYNVFLPTRAIDDDDLTTYWASTLTGQMPQSLDINFNQSQTFSTVQYFIPPALNYPNNGGYPTSFQIETSADGATWINKGTFSGSISSNSQTVDIGLTTANYLRFTSLACAPYYGSRYNCIFISGIQIHP